MADSLAAALAELQANPPRIGKKARAQYGNYADLPTVHKALMPRLSELGLLWQTWPAAMTIPGYDGDDRLTPVFVLWWKLTHLATGEHLQGAFPIHAADPQKAGSEITYARRYALVTVTGVTPEGDDDDGQAASRQRTPTKIPGPDHERLQPRAEPGDRPAERLRAPVENDPVDMWIDQPSPESDEQPEERPGSVTAEQLRKLGIAFTKAGIVDKAVRLGMVSDMIGRTVMSSKQLSQVEYEFLLRKIKDGEQP